MQHILLPTLRRLLGITAQLTVCLACRGHLCNIPCNKCCTADKACTVNLSVHCMQKG
jgi:hypothetical protein